MSVDSTTVWTVAMTVSGALVIGYGTLLLARLKHQGDMERILARAVVDRRTRSTILWGLGLLSGMFVALGALRLVEELGVVSDNVSDVTASVIFITGAATLVYLTRIGMTLADMSLENELDLRDLEPQVYSALRANAAPQDATPTGMYGLFPIEEPSSVPPPSREATLSGPPPATPWL